jgi:hypothetical protein
VVDFLNDNSGFAASLAAFLSFLATLALVFVTFVYARHTRRLAEVTKEPEIEPWLDPRGPGLVFLHLVNCGTGAATDVEIRISYSNASGEVVWTWPSLAPGEAYQFNFVNPGTHAFVSSMEEVAKLGTMKFCAAYKVFGGSKRRELHTMREIDLERVLQSSIDFQMTVDQPRRVLTSIRDELRKLNDQIGKLHG